MKHLDLLGINLKDDVLSDLFETYDVDVVYDYDRTHENIPDVYRANVPALGVQFVFDDRQTFCTLFMTKFEADGFNPFEADEESLPKFESKADALRHADENGVQFSEGKASFLGEEKDWVRFEYSGYSVHYEFVESALSMITIQAGDA